MNPPSPSPVGLSWEAIGGVIFVEMPAAPGSVLGCGRGGGGIEKDGGVVLLASGRDFDAVGRPEAKGLAD